MQQLRSVWEALNWPRRMMALGAAAGVFAAVLGLARLAATPSMSLLYAGLEGPQAGQVIQALDQRGLRYEVRGDAIYVEQTARDETRMAMAAQGLPANSAAGYELLDELTGFGTTSQMFDAAYWRAKEGELARTILASPHVRAARVHISHGSAQPFRRESNLTASVTVTPSGASLPGHHAHALRYLVASAVAGLSPENVSVIDTASGLVASDIASGTSGERTTELRRNVQRLLDAHVGPGRSVVEVNIDTVTDRETIVERRIDPDTRIAVSTDTEERNATSTDSRTGAVTVASNLPDGDAAAGQGRAESRDVQTRQRTAYEVSQTSREVQRGPGAIRRLTVAVMVDGITTPGPDGAPQWEPRPAPELDALRDLVSSAVGFDADRGDVITLHSLRFDVPALTGTEGGRGFAQNLGLDAMGLIRLAALALVALILALFVVRPLLRPAATVVQLPPRAPNDGGPASLTGPALTGEITDRDPEIARLRSLGADGRAAGSDGSAAEAQDADPVARMRALIAGRQDETLEILRGWMDDRPTGTDNQTSEGR